jgi:hypothetical protein
MRRRPDRRPRTSGSFGAIASEKPVPIASTNTRSVVSSRLSALSTNGKLDVFAFGSPV